MVDKAYLSRRASRSDACQCDVDQQHAHHVDPARRGRGKNLERDHWQLGSPEAPGPRSQAEVVERMLGSSASSDSSSSSDAHSSHPHEALLFLISSIVVGTIIAHLLTLPIFKGIQQTVMLFVIGVLCSLVQEGLHVSKHIGVFGRSYNMWMEIDPHLLLFTMLPPLVTGDAMTIDTSVARRVAKQCLYLAGPGVCVNALLMAGFLYMYLPYDWSFLLCLTTGAILCATDPVAVVALLKELGASPTLTVQIQGESLLNDGTAIVLYTIAYDMLKGQSYDAGDVIQFLVKMAIYAWSLGLLIGVLFFVWLQAANNKLSHNSTVIQASLTICCAYTSFVIAEGAFHISGVLATVASALVLAHKMWPYVVCKDSMHDVWHMLEYLGNTVIFFLAGALTGRVMIRIEFQDYIHLLMIYLAATFFRGLILFSSRPLLTRLRADREEVTASDALVMTWGGLRGAIGLALAIQVQVDKAGGQLSNKDADRVLFYVSGIAAMTLMINATTCPGLVKWLGITQMPATKRKMLQILNTQLVVSTRKTPRPKIVQDVIDHMLEEVDHHIDTDSNAHGFDPDYDHMDISGHRRVQDFIIEEDDLELDYMLVPMVTQGSTNTAMVSVRAGHKLVEELDRVKSQFANLTWDVLDMLSEMPAIPLLDQQVVMKNLAIEYVPDPAIQRAINEAFLSLVRAQYWQMVRKGVFVSFAHEAAHLLSSIELAFSRPHYDLTDFGYIKPYIAADFEQSQGNLIFQEEEIEHVVSEGEHENSCVHGIIDSAPFAITLACLIIANTIFVYIEQALVDDDGTGIDLGWLIADIVFNALFTFEFLLKFYDLRWEYFKEGWNVFDFCLVCIGVFGVATSCFAETFDDNESLSSSEARLVRVVQIFRMMRIIRLFRLVRFFRKIKSKLFKSRLSLETAEHMQKITILSCFIRAHCESQESIVKYFGRDGGVNGVELARCILQSQLSCYQSMIMAINEKKLIDPRILNEVRIAKEAKALAEELEQFIVDVHECGVIGASEAESILHPLHHHVHAFQQVLLDSQAGRISNILDIADEEPEECRMYTATPSDMDRDIMPATLHNLHGLTADDTKMDVDDDNDCPSKRPPKTGRWPARRRSMDDPAAPAAKSPDQSGIYYGGIKIPNQSPRPAPEGNGNRAEADVAEKDKTAEKVSLAKSTEKDGNADLITPLE